MTAPRVAQFFVPGRLPSMNDLMLEKAVRFKKKKSWCQPIELIARSAGIAPFKRAHIRMELHEPNKRRDPDGACAGASKVILDALQHAGVLENDGWSQIASLTFSWRCVPERPGVLVTLIEAT